MGLPKLAVIIPCFNEREVIGETLRRVFKVLGELEEKALVSKESYVLVVDDGSKDGTWEVIRGLKSKYGNKLKGIKLRRNFGHQNALLCGMLESEYDVAITMDADLQDPPELIEEMVKLYHGGYEIIYGVRRERDVDSNFKRISASLFYNLMERMGVRIVKNHADFRLVSREVVETLREFKEVNLFLRALFPYLGFKGKELYYRRRERFAGKSKYPITKMVSFALEGITSFSVAPLRLILFSGFVLFLVATLLSLWAVGVKIMGRSIPGWFSIALPLYLLNGINLMAIGIVGEYVGKIYMEVKRRPRYLIEERL